jgi:hypothetical protein
MSSQALKMDDAERSKLTKRVLFKLDVHVLPPLAFVRPVLLVHRRRNS